MSSGTRMLLALVLVMAILLIYNNYISKRSTPERKPATVQDTVVTRELVEPPAPVPVAQPEPEEEDTIVVETEKYRVALSSHRGAVISFQLKEYEGVGGGWTERIRELEEWTKERVDEETQNGTDEWTERKKTLAALDKWMKKSYGDSPENEIAGWIRTGEEHIEALRESYSGLGAECERLLERIGEFPSWAERNYRGWVELIPVGARTLTLRFQEDVAPGAPHQVEREQTSEGEVVRFRYRLGEDREFTKTFVFHPSEYLLDIEVSGDVEHYSLDWNSGLAITEGKRNDDLTGFASVAFMGGQFLKENLGDLAKRKYRKPTSGSVDWVGLRTKYFLACLFPENSSETEGFESYLELSTAETPHGPDKAFFGCMPYRGVRHSGSARISVSLICPKENRFSAYVGPIDYEELKKLDADAERIVDFGWSWIAPLSRLLFRVLTFLHSHIPNYGVVIIIFSLITKLLFYPLTHRGTRSMREMAKLQPRMKEIQKQFKNDPKRMNREVMELYRKHKVNPLGGCLPLLIQMPIFIALYSVLRTTIELRRAAFIPFWIKDLSVQDPYYILPLLMGGFMLLQSLLTPSDPRQRMTAFFMPVVITVIFLNFPAGLVLYWLVNNIFSVAEHFILARREVSTAESVGQ